jgi:hypothetical protein
MFEYKLTVLNELQLAVLDIAVGSENLISSIQIPRVFTTIKHVALGVLIVKQGIRMMNI